MENYRALGIATLWGLSAAHSLPAKETESAANSTKALAEIIVTAQKREEKLQDVPLAVTVVGAEQLANQHVYTIADLARMTPALEMVQAFGGPGGGGQIRGIGTQSFTRSAEGAVGIWSMGCRKATSIPITSSICNASRYCAGPRGRSSA